MFFLIGATVLLWGALAGVDKNAGYSLLVMVMGFPVQWVWSTFARTRLTSAWFSGSVSGSPTKTENPERSMGHDFMMAALSSLRVSQKAVVCISWSGRLTSPLSVRDSRFSWATR